MVIHCLKSHHAKTEPNAWQKYILSPDSDGKTAYQLASEETKTYLDLTLGLQQPSEVHGDDSAHFPVEKQQMVPMNAFLLEDAETDVIREERPTRQLMSYYGEFDELLPRY